MRKIALGKKTSVLFAIFAVAVFCFFGKNNNEALAWKLHESVNIQDAPAGATETALNLIRTFPSTSITNFEKISVDGTSAKFTFTVSLKEGVNGATVTEDNTITTMGGWDKIFENTDTTFKSDSETEYAFGHGLYLDIATTKKSIVDLFPVSGDFNDRKSFYNDKSHVESWILENNTFATTTEEENSFIDGIKNSEILSFGEGADEVTSSEGSFPVSLTVAQLKPDGFDPTTQDLDTIIVKELLISDLYPNTTYYAQVRIEEDVSGIDNADYTQIAISPTIIKFTTGDGPVPENGPVLTTTVLDGASVVENDSNWLTADLNCGIRVFNWQSKNTSLLDCIPLALYKFVYVPSAAILYFAGSMMDVFFGWTISSSIYRDSTFVVDGWRIVRDLCNICFILALVFAAVQAILQMGGSIRRTVVSVIIIGLLINFSLFFSRVVIDAGNALARVFYNQITISGVSSGVAITSSDIEFKPLSQAIMDGMNIQKVVSSDVLGAVKNAGWSSYSDEAAVTIIVIVGIFLNVTAAWAFFLISWTFVGRIVGLWLAMIVSPIPFISRVMPRMGTLIGNNSMGAWFSNLLTLSFMAPIFIFLMYLLILMLESGFLSSLIKF